MATALRLPIDRIAVSPPFVPGCRPGDRCLENSFGRAIEQNIHLHAQRIGRFHDCGSMFSDRHDSHARSLSSATDMVAFVIVTHYGGGVSDSRTMLYRNMLQCSAIWLSSHVRELSSTSRNKARNKSIADLRLQIHQQIVIG